MTKASRPTRIEGYKMFFDSATEVGPQKGQTITINGNSKCTIKQARLVSNKGHFFYRIVAQDETGTHFSTSMPTEVLQYTGWGWNDSPIPYDLEITRDEFDWHIVDGQTQRELDVRAPTKSAAVAKATNANRGFGETVLVHPVFTMSIKPSGSRWMASMRRLLKDRGAKNPLSDTFTHPSATTCATGPFERLSRRDVIQFGQELNELFEKYMPGGVKWPALGEGMMMCTTCCKPVVREGLMPDRCEC